MLRLNELIAVIKLQQSMGSSRDGCPSDASRPGSGSHASFGSSVPKRAGVMLIIKDGLILGISRRHNKDIYGLPGGKFDAEAGDVYTSDTAIREAFEETKIVVNICVKIYQRVELGDGPNPVDFYSTCYYATEWEGEPQSSEEGDIKWLTVEEITSSKAAFGSYNAEAIRIFREMYPEVVLL